MIQSIASFAAAAGALGQAEVLLDDLRHQRGSLRGRSFVALSGATIASIVGFVVALLLGLPWQVALVGLLFVPVINQSQMWRAFAISRRELMLPGLSNGFAAIMRTAAIGVLFAFGWLSATTAIGSIQGALAMGAVLALGIYFRKNRREYDRAHPERLSVGSLVSRGAPVLVFTMLTTITLRSDVIVLSLLSTPDQLGVYAASSALSMAVLSVSGAFKTRAQSAAFSANAPRAVAIEIGVVLAVGLAGAIVALPLAPLLVDLLLGPGYESAIPLIRVLAFASAILMVLDVVHGLLAVLGARGWMIAVSAVGASATLVSLLLLVSSYAALGAAWASLISYAAAAAAGLVVISRVLRSSTKGKGSEADG